MKKIVFLCRVILVIFVYINFTGCAKNKCTQSLSPKVECNYQFHNCEQGDVNCNYLAYEVADATLFAHYFVEGISIFSPDSSRRAYQVCAADVNLDCRSLTLSDLVYLIRMILHDVRVLPTPSSDILKVTVSNNIVTTKCVSPIGAVWFEFDVTVVPTLLTDNMEMLSKDNKILVWSRNGNCIENNTAILSFVGNTRLIYVEAVDCDGRELRTSITTK